MSVARETNSNLPDLLAARARAASDGSLATSAAGGLIVAIAVAAWRPAHWLALVSACVCVAAFGGWGIADRELLERAHGPHPMKPILLRLARAAVAGIGVISAIILLVDLVSVTLGNWIN